MWKYLQKKNHQQSIYTTTKRKKEISSLPPSSTTSDSTATVFFQTRDINGADLHEISRGLIAAVSSLSHPPLSSPPPGHTGASAVRLFAQRTYGCNWRCAQQSLLRTQRTQIEYVVGCGGGDGVQEGRALMHLFMEDPESHGARCGNTAKSCQFTTTTCLANGGGRELDLHSQLSRFNGKYAALTAAFLHPLAWRGGVGWGRKKEKRTVHV